MKILFDHQIFCLQKYGGISRYFFELANHITRLSDQDVTIFAPMYINEYLSRPNLVRSRGIKIQDPFGLGRAVAWSVDSALALMKLKPRGNVEIFHETYYSGVDCCPRSAKRIITVFDMTHEKLPEMRPGRDKTRQVKAEAVKRADHVLCISENTRRDLIELLAVPEEKTSVVHLGYSLAVKSFKKSSIGEKPYILYVGPRRGYKNFNRLLRVYAASAALKNEFSLVCFGGGEFSAEELRDIGVQGLPMSSVIHVSGGDEILAGLYSGAAVFVYPSLYEGFGMPPLEAMSFGCPVVCSNNSSLPEVVGDAAELFEPADEDAMSAAIERVAFSPLRSRSLVDHGYERIRRFSWEKCSQETLNVYKSALRV